MSGVAFSTSLILLFHHTFSSATVFLLSLLRLAPVCAGASIAENTLDTSEQCNSYGTESENDCARDEAYVEDEPSKKANNTKNSRSTAAEFPAANFNAKNSAHDWARKNEPEGP